MKNKLKSYGENASWRLKLVTKALADEDGSNEATDPLPLIKSSSRQASKLLLCIKRYQDAMPWERPKLWISPAPDAETLQQVEMSLRGMEMALASHLSQRENDTMSEQLKDELRRAADRPCSRIEQIKNSSLFESSKVDGAIDTSCATLRDLSVLFFLQCMNLLNEGSRFGQEGVGKRMRILCGLLPKVRRQNVLFAVKCSLSLGLAVLLGLTYTKQNAYWSGLTIAISFATRRQATFSATNARAQGTALGTVYGALAYFVCHRFELLKLASLLPWIIFTTFLRHSEMYGETGSISATVAALLILGRKDYGTPTDFAVARLVESFIGLSCLILVEILICPERAAVLVKMRASHTFRDLNLLFGDIVAEIDDTGSNSSTSSLVDKKKGMRIQVDALKRLIEEAREEPSFWFKPFPDDCYTRLLECVQRMADVLYLMAYSVDALKLEVKKPEINIGLFKRVLSAAFGSVEEVMRTNKYNGRDQKPQFKESSFNDIEAGDEEASTILDSFLQNAQDLIECREVMADPKHKKRMLVSIGSLAFCMQSLVADTTEARRIVGELNLRESL